MVAVRLHVLALLVACLPWLSLSFPVLVASNGSAVLTSAFGQNVVLQPAAGGAVFSSALINASAGVQLNGTLLNEALLSQLLAASGGSASSSAVINASAGIQLNGTLLNEALVHNLLATVASLTSSSLPTCAKPSGTLSFFNGSWVCACSVGWYGPSCTSQYVIDFFNTTQGFSTTGQFAAAFDAAGMMYMPDGSCIKSVSPTGAVTIFAGQCGNAGHADGPALTAQFYSVLGIAFNANTTTMYVADSNRANPWDTRYSYVRVITSGVVSTLAVGTPDVPATCPGRDGPGTQAVFGQWFFYNGGGANSNMLAVDANDNVFIAESGSHRIRMISPNGTVTTVAGGFGSVSVGNGCYNTPSGFYDGPGTSASLNTPTSLAFDAAGNLFFAENGNPCIRKVDTTGLVTSVAGSCVQLFNNAGLYSSSVGSPPGGKLDGPLTIATMGPTNSIAFGGDGTLYFIDSYGLRSISPQGLVSTIAINFGVLGPAYVALEGLQTDRIPLSLAVFNSTIYVVANTYYYGWSILTIQIGGNSTSTPGSSPSFSRLRAAGLV